ncbi:hypothetical protein IE53DRAFT_24152 [Violaceomyces palustris]|uniref:Uncharacterized protein n=1 Tax=Violaceomyces palustris TaxID=1673888 RepID=A0ACD0P7Y1_9BASI|nr:hypothetical protein IE53DRAFT_24152 [Violaceomyces palustris]
MQNFAGFGALRLQQEQRQRVELAKREQERLEWERREWERRRQEEEREWYNQQHQTQERYQSQTWYPNERYNRASSSTWNQLQRERQSDLHSHQEKPTRINDHSGSVTASLGREDDICGKADAASVTFTMTRTHQLIIPQTFAHDNDESCLDHCSRKGTTTQSLQGTDCSSPGLPYDGSSEDGKGATVFNSRHLTNHRPSSTLAAALCGSGRRDTVYEDDFEESEDEDINPSGWTRKNRLAGYSDKESVYSDASENHLASLRGQGMPAVRGTVYEPSLPKAKCADCGEFLSFEELSDHSCLPRGDSSSSLCTLISGNGVKDSGSPLLGLGTTLFGSESASSTPSVGSFTRSPFFEKYNHWNGGGSKPGSSFTLPPLEGLAGTSQSCFAEEQETTPRASIIKMVSSKSQDCHLVGMASQPSTASLSALHLEKEDERVVIERKKKIEEQRAAKKLGGWVAAANSVISTMRLNGIDPGSQGQETSKYDSKPLATPMMVESDAESQLASRFSRKERPRPHHKQASSSSISSYQSSLKDPHSPNDFSSGERRSGRDRENSSGTGTSFALTPSSSYDRLSEGQASPNPGSSLGPVLGVGIPPSRSRKNMGRSGQRSDLDLGGIEDLVNELTASPEQYSEPLSSDTVNESNSEEAIKSRKSALDVQESRRRAKDRAAATMEAADREAKERARKREKEREREFERQRLRELEREKEREKVEREREIERLRKLRRKKEEKERRDKQRAERSSRKCCVCSCSLSSSKTPFVERDGKLLCARDWKELYLPKCRKCGEAVEKGAVKASDGALKGIFHKPCFSCFTCNKAFEDGSFYVFKNEPYCARHYHKLNGSLCAGCGEGIEGGCRQTESGERFHPRCFTCEYDEQGEFCLEVSGEGMRD